jgi:hypothetical protein
MVPAQAPLASEALPEQPVWAAPAESPQQAAWASLAESLPQVLKERESFPARTGPGFQGSGSGFGFRQPLIYFNSIYLQGRKLDAKSGIARTHKNRNLNIRFVTVSTVLAEGEW